MLRNGTKDLHLYLTPDDQKRFAEVKRWMNDLGVVNAGPQTVIRFALQRTAYQAKNVKRPK